MTLFGLYLLALLTVPGYRTCNGSTSPTSASTSSLISPAPQLKPNYGDNCTTNVACDDHNGTISCNSLVSKCLCVDGRYHDGHACINYTSLTPKPDSPILGTNNITITWAATEATNYTDMYHLNITASGAVVHTNSTDEKTFTFVGLEQGTVYEVSLVRTITRLKRPQNLPAISDSYRTKVDYNQTCTENDTCIDANATCQVGRCRCDQGFYRRDATCVSIDELKPMSVDVKVDNTTTMTITWTSPSDSVVTGYEVSVISSNTRNNFTVGKDYKNTTITDLTPGRVYNVSVETMITYMQGKDEKTTAFSAKPTVMTPDTVNGLGDKTNLTAPDIMIDFLKADGDVDSYLVQLQGINDTSYNQTNDVTAPATNTTFRGVVPNYQYNLSITTLSNQQQSVPYTQTVLVRASQADPVEGFKTSARTSRTVEVFWKRPNKTNGDLFQYHLEVFDGTCKQRIVFNCTECKENVSMEAGEHCEHTTNVPISQSDITNSTYEVNYRVTGLLPDTEYVVTVAAYNQEGRGIERRLQVLTEEEAPDIGDDSVSAPTSPESLTSVTLSICGRCLHDDKNGKVTVTGLLICVNPARKRRAAAVSFYDTYTNWHTSKTGGFQEQYRTTPDDWDAGLTDKIHFKYTVGEEQCPSDPPPRFCNGPLPEGSTLSITAFACTEAACAEGPPVEVKTRAQNPVSPDVGLIIGAAAAAVVCVAVIFLLIWVIRRRRQAEKGEKHLSTEENNTEDRVARKRPVKISEFESHVDAMHKDSNLEFSKEFEDICALSPKHACKASETDGNRLRNRYVNILPFDHTRVKLRSLSDDDEDNADYINANYIPGKNSPREYIATQGPMTGTVSDFWRMIWEQDVSIIIMLSDLQEKGKPKVDKYWPDKLKEPVQYGDIIVEMINYSPLNKYVIKIFQLTVGEESRKVRHYFLPGWQDFGANLTPNDVISFVRDVRMQTKPTDKGPICVHCSAGVGRTGTYISLDVFKQATDEENFEKELDVFDFVMKMRENRSYMVQTEKQYIFIHDTIKEMIIRKKKEIEEREQNNIYQNTGEHMKPEENIHANQAYEPDPEELYMDVTPGQPTTVL